METRCEISSSHVGEYEDDFSLMLRRVVSWKATEVSDIFQGDRPGDGDCKHVRNVGQFLRGYTA
jgi:hypothetical protein